MLAPSPTPPRFPAAAMRLALPGQRAEWRLPLFACAVRAGFPSPADDYIQGRLDLNLFLVRDEPGTFMVRMEGDALHDIAILAGDVLVVERGLPAGHGDLIVAELDGAFIVRELRREFGAVALFAHHRSFPVIRLAEEQELVVFGVVRAVVRKFAERVR